MLDLLNKGISLGKSNYKVPRVYINVSEIETESDKLHRVGVIAFTRNYRNGGMPTMNFDPKYVDELNDFFRQHIPNITFAKDYS